MEMLQRIRAPDDTPHGFLAPHIEDDDWNTAHPFYTPHVVARANAKISWMPVLPW
ncbi:hypothetical protein [Pseudomonas fluorescens]|uniref:hypothetical protein n=1 Tax=Pseudomonas fluorescens TaxID=294 RepID=UPI00177FAEDA|nr:hypothetical protein [Pseudomonas fluorescens]